MLGIIGFIKSIASRKNYKCPVCGETFRAENMEAKICTVCGANLEEIRDNDTNDKTK